jgi:excisionase family DNA binding protein
MAKHRPKWQQIRIHRTYSVEEAALTLGVSKGTVRRWVKLEKLQLIETRKPILIHGSSIRSFGKSKIKSKIKCALHEFYCFSCKAPRPAAGGMADFVAQTPKSGNLKAICGACDTIMNKHVSCANLPALTKLLDIANYQAAEHLVECLNSRSNSNLEIVR